MSHANTNGTGSSDQRAWFVTTHWTQVLTAKDSSSPQAAAALEKLCHTYWYPLYAYVRRLGENKESAEDLTQAFFARLLERHYLAEVQREKGKFRSFLLGTLKHFLNNEWDKARAIKRGGGVTILSLDDTEGEERYALEPVDDMDAAKLYDRRWALTLLEQVRARLKREFVESRKAEQYEQLKVYEAADKNGPPYAEVAAKLAISVKAVKAAVFRLRRRFRELIREEVANTVERPEEVDDEIRYLLETVRR